MIKATALSVLILAMMVVPSDSQVIKKLNIGAHFYLSDKPMGWLPPLEYDFCIISEPPALSRYQYVLDYLRKHHKPMGLEIYELATVGIPSEATLDRYVTGFDHYFDFITVGEEIPDSSISTANARYDYIKSKWPNLQVYQWPHTNYFDFDRLGELKADGFVINPRWYWGYNDWKARFLDKAMAFGKPVINLIYIVEGRADAPELWWNYTWDYSIDQYIDSRLSNVPVGIVYALNPSSPENEALYFDRLRQLYASWKDSKGR